MDISILNKATDISESTKEVYRSNLNKVNEYNTEDIKLSDIEGMKKVVESITDNPDTQGNYYSVIMKILQLSNKLELREKYKPLLKATIKKHDNEPKKLTKGQKNILKKNYEKLKHDFVVSSKKKGIPTLSEIDFVLLFYVLLPPRRSDYYNMIYTTNEEKTKNEEHNYLIKTDTGLELVFNNFKNVKKIGKQRFRIGSSRKERSLRRVIKNRGLKEGQFIYSKSRRQFTRDLGTATKRVFGEKLLINDLRIIHNTSKFIKIDTTELKKDAQQMGHSVQAKLNNYIRD